MKSWLKGLLITLAFIAFASEASVYNTSEDGQKACREAVEVFFEVAVLRQQGYSIIEVLDIEFGWEDNYTVGAKHGIVEMVFRRTKVYNTQQFKEREVNKFVNDTYLGCLEYVSKKGGVK